MKKIPQLSELLKSKIELNEGESIKEFEYISLNYKGYVTNYGRVFSKFGKELKKVYRGGTNKTYYIHLWKRGKKNAIYLSLPRLVYKTFVDNNLPDNCHVIHKDKDRTNCRADNLSIGLEKSKIKGKLSQERYKMFNNPITTEYIRKKLCRYYNNDFEKIKDGVTLEDLIQESLMLVYKALFNYNYLDDPIENSKQYRKYVYAIVEKFICKKYVRDYRTIRLLKEDMTE